RAAPHEDGGRGDAHDGADALLPRRRLREEDELVLLGVLELLLEAVDSCLEGLFLVAIRHGPHLCRIGHPPSTRLGAERARRSRLPPFGGAKWADRGREAHRRDRGAITAWRGSLAHAARGARVTHGAIAVVHAKRQAIVVAARVR